MILVRAPLRINFTGEGSDVPPFYLNSPGRALSATIDKYVFLTINKTPMIDRVTARYSRVETVDHPNELQHTRIRAALLHLGITKNIEIGSFASLVHQTGLGSSSSFSAALIKGLHAYLDKKITTEETAQAAYHLESDLLKEYGGKQDPYTAAFGGLNSIVFNMDGSVQLKPVLLDYQSILLLQSHLLLFYTGIAPASSDVSHYNLIAKKREVYQRFADSVDEFKALLVHGDMLGIGRFFDEIWRLKKSLSLNYSSQIIDELYDCSKQHGAWGGMLLAGGGGCLLIASHPERHDAISEKLLEVSREHGLMEARAISFSFVQSGTDILYNGCH